MLSSVFHWLTGDPDVIRTPNNVLNGQKISDGNQIDCAGELPVRYELPATKLRTYGIGSPKN
jgi:hypothetical protein